MELDQSRLTSALADCPIGHTFFHYHSIPSTMPIAQELARDPAIRSGTLVIAEEQTAGRGRQQRRWETPPSQALLVSYLFKAPFPVAPALFPLLTGLAMVRGIAAYLPPLAPHVGLKWPNDLLLGTSMADANKVGGILIESVYQGSEAVAIIAGCGLNVLQDRAVLPETPPGAPDPTSIHHFIQTHPTLAAACPPLDRTELLISICRQWSQLYTDPALTSALLLQQWAEQLWTLGQAVVVQTTNAQGESIQIVGKATGVLPDGQLIVESATGARHHFAAGDVSVRNA